MSDSPLHTTSPDLFFALLKSPEPPPEVADNFSRKWWPNWGQNERRDWLGQWYEVIGERFAS